MIKCAIRRKLGLQGCVIFGLALTDASSGATWDKFIFEWFKWQEEQLLNNECIQKAHKREIVIVTCGDEAQRYEPADLHMLNKKLKEPNLQ